MRIAVQNPTFIFKDQSKNFNGYNFEFLKKYCDVIFLYCKPWKFMQYRKKLKQLGWNKNICFTVFGLNRQADILVCFNGNPYIRANKPCKYFRGVKIYHTMDFSDNAELSGKCMKDNNVDYLMGYCKHDRYSAFFRKYFFDYLDKVIGVPFGYGKRFECIVPFENRINKCVALGSVNLTNDNLMNEDTLRDYILFYSECKYSHEVRKAIVDNANAWENYIDSLLPVWPETKNPNYNAVEKLNEYKMFVNDASIDKFPPARTYEGIACGAVMVAEDLEVYKDIGFINDFNCILFKQGDYDDMISRISFYMENPDKLLCLHKESVKLAEKYTHEKVADELYKKIKKILKEE